MILSFSYFLCCTVLYQGKNMYVNENEVTSKFALFSCLHLWKCEARVFLYSRRVMEYPELEGTMIHKDHRVQLLALHRTTQKPDCMSESTVETLLELWHLGAMPTALWCRPCPQPPSAPPQHSSMPFPRALSLLQGTELSAAPLLPVRSCSRHQASPQLLCSVLNNPRDLNHPSYIFPSIPCPILVPSFGYSHIVFSPLCPVVPNLHPVAMLGLVRSRTQLTLLAARAHCGSCSTSCQPDPIDPSPQICSSACLPFCTYI